MHAIDHRPTETETEDLPILAADTPRGVMRPSGQVRTQARSLERFPKAQNRSLIRHVVPQLDHPQVHLQSRPVMREVEALLGAVKPLRFEMHRRLAAGRHLHITQTLGGPTATETVILTDVKDGQRHHGAHPYATREIYVTRETLVREI